MCLIFEFECIGGDNNLAVVLGATSNPFVACEEGQAPSRRACSAIVAFMDASLTRRRFGEGLAAPDVRLPFVYKSGKFPHLLALFSFGI